MQGQKPLETSEWLTAENPKGTQKFKGNTGKLADLISAFNYRACALVHETSALLVGKPSLEGWNSLVPLAVEPMALAYGEAFALGAYAEFTQTVEDANTRTFLEKFGLIYGCMKIVEYAGFYRSADYMSTDQVDRAKDVIINLCAELKKDLLLLTDCLPFQEQVVAGALGHKDGRVYTQFLNNVYAAPKAFERAEWWKSIYE